MIKAIIFDCFGVLATEAWLPFKVKYFGHDPNLYEQATKIRRQADLGLIDYDDSVRAVAELAGVSKAEAARATEGNAPNEKLFAFIKKLKSDYKLGLLSNVAGDYLWHIFTKKQLAEFDAIVLSYQSGYVKPQPTAFANAARQLGVKTNECIFIDDQQQNVDGAQDAGMKAILYNNIGSLKKELAELL